MIVAERDVSADIDSDNPEARFPCVLCLDNSGSMEGAHIQELNSGLVVLRDELLKDPLTCLRLELAVVTFGGEVTVMQDFVSPDRFTPPILEAGGNTPLGAAAHKSLDLIQERKSRYEALDLDHYGPWVILVTDFEATDAEDVLRSASARIWALETKRDLAFFSVGVEQANMEKLSRLSIRPPRKLKGLNYQKLFQWVGQSWGQVSASQPGDRVKLPVATWSEVCVVDPIFWTTD